MRVVNESFKGRVRDLSCYRKRKQLDEKQILVPIVWCVRFQRFSSVLSGTITTTCNCIPHLYKNESVQDGCVG